MVAAFGEPAQGRPEVAVVCLQSHRPRALIRAHQSGLGLLGQGQEEARVGTPGVFGLACLLERLEAYRKTVSSMPYRTSGPCQATSTSDLSTN